MANPKWVVGALLLLSGCRRTQESAATGAGSAQAALGSAPAARPTASAAGATSAAAPAKGGHPAAAHERLPERVKAIRRTVKAPCPAGMAYVPATTFKIGTAPSPFDELEEITESQFNDELDDEKPAHDVSVRAFCIDLVPVTIADYEACVEGQRCTKPVATKVGAPTNDACNRDAKRLPDAPIECVGHAQATAYCAAAGFHLPTEPEWELAARGKDGRVYPWGTPKVPAKGSIPFGRPQACDSKDAAVYEKGCLVGALPLGASPFGVLDMAGSHEEWTASPFCSYEDLGCTSKMLVVRSGFTPFTARTFARRAAKADRSEPGLGFRCAASLP